MPLELNVSHAQTREHLHQVIAKVFAFPSYYGGNWDAFDECISEPALALPSVVRVRGYSALLGALPHEAKLLRQCLERASAERMFALQWIE